MKQTVFELSSAYQTYVWGGNRIATHFQRHHLPPRVAESWEVSDRSEAVSTILNGPFKGKTLKDVLETMREDLVGRGRDSNRFPVLIKIIDAKQHLSIQVHPSTSSKGAEAKTECWIALLQSDVLDGFKAPLTQKALEQSIHDGTLPSLLHKTSLAPFEADLIHGGTIHAILEGAFLYEVQQNSNTTYRLYDGGRVGVDGKPRPLHIHEALDVIDLHPSNGHKQIPIREGKGVYRLVETPFFIVRKIDVEQQNDLPLSPDSFLSIFVAAGSGVMVCDGISHHLQCGASFLIAASAKSCKVEGALTLIATSLPQELTRSAR